VVLVLLALPALFTRGTEAFVRGLLMQEMEDLPKGASLLRYVPRLAAKLLPLAAIALGYISARGRRLSDWLVPFALGAVILMLVYPTRAYEYGLPSVLGFTPLLMVWALQPGESGARLIRQVLVYGFLLFIGFASLSTRLFSSLYSVVQFHVGMALLFMLAPVLLALAQRPGQQPSLEVERM
jgi:heme A synthase